MAPACRRPGGAVRGGAERSVGIGENVPVTAGKRAGARRRRQLRPALLALPLGATAATVAWGYLVLAAIDSGTSAREGDPSAWWLLGLSALGAVACLSLALVLLARATRALGLTRAPGPRRSYGSGVPRRAHRES